MRPASTREVEILERRNVRKLERATRMPVTGVNGASLYVSRSCAVGPMPTRPTAASSEYRTTFRVDALAPRSGFELVASAAAQAAVWK